jgi:hypothetical protein
MAAPIAAGAQEESPLRTAPGSAWAADLELLRALFGQRLPSRVDSWSLLQKATFAEQRKANSE